MRAEQTCRVCGCTEDKACLTTAGPCWWVEPGLCSACAARHERALGRLGSRSPLYRMAVIIAFARQEYLLNASDLARLLEVSTKTVHRDIEFLRDQMGLDFEYVPDRFGYRLPPVFCC